MARTRVYIKPFDTTGNYVADFIEVTGDVLESSLSNITRSIDSTTYDAGVFKYSHFSIKMSNEHGRYSDVDSLRSIFATKRSDSIIKITWDPNNDELFPGVIKAGQVKLKSDIELVIFEGLINDESSRIDVATQQITFDCFGYEYLFQRMEVPYGSISVGDSVGTILFTCLNQAPFNSLVTVTAGNFNPGTNQNSDVVTSLENKTVKEAVEALLVAGNAILYIKDNVVYVSDRTESASSQYTFYGQASNNGIENIQKITAIRNGLNRIFNYWTWKDTTLKSRYEATITTFGIRKKEISSDLFTDTTKRQNILDAFRTEFGPKKREFELTTALDYTRFQLELLDKVNVDYPTVFTPALGEELPLYGTATYGVAKYPYGEWTATIDVTDDWKIIGIKYNIKNALITFKLREV